MNDLMMMNGGTELSAEMSKKLQTLQMQVQTLELCRQLGAHYSCTNMIPKQYQGKPEDAAVAIQWGMEIGLQPLQSLQNVAVINGSPALWGDALIAIIKGSGQCEYIRSEFDEESMTAIVSTKRKGEPEESRSFSMADAKAAGLASRQTYQQHPKRMLNARARSHVLRDVYADLLRGFQVREISEEDHKVEKDITPSGQSETLKALLSKPSEPKAVESKPEPEQKPEPVKQQSSNGQANPDGVKAMESLISECKSLDELQLLATDIKESPRLNQAEKAGLRKAWGEKKASFSKQEPEF